MRSILLSILFVFCAPVMVGCDEGNGQVKEEEGGKTDATCFTRLHPGAPEGKKLAGVAFQDGACIEGYKALNKFSFQENVYVASTNVDELTSDQKSPLYLSKGKIGVKVEGEMVAIGRYIEDGLNVDLALNDGIDFKLKIADKGEPMRDWTLEDADTARDKEAVLLIVNSL